jgi:hypothetical protein
MYGIENLKKLAHLGLGLGMQISTAFEDGKFTWKDAFGFVDELMEVPGVLKNWNAIKDELEDLDAAEREELHAYIIQEFDIPNDRIEHVVEFALGVGINAVGLVDLVKSLKSKP